jgi:hypothetical protein
MEYNDLLKFFCPVTVHGLTIGLYYMEFLLEKLLFFNARGQIQDFTHARQELYHWAIAPAWNKTFEKLFSKNI